MPTNALFCFGKPVHEPVLDPVVDPVRNRFEVVYFSHDEFGLKKVVQIINLDV